MGTRGVGGYTREDYNRFDGDVCSNLVTDCGLVNRTLNPGWGELTYIDNEGQSIYHGMNAQLRKAYSQGFCSPRTTLGAKCSTTSPRVAWEITLTPTDMAGCKWRTGH